MKLIWFSHFVPFPPRGGNLQRSFNLIRQISRTRETHLFALNLAGESSSKIEEYKAELNRYCRSVEVCDLPFPWRGRRWWAEALASPLFREPFSCRALFSNNIVSRWKRLLNAHPDALLHFDSIDLASYADSARDFRKVLNHHNCESAMTLRLASNEKNPVQRAYLRLQAAKLAEAERSLCRSFDVNTVVSEQDRQRLQSIQPAGKYYVVENGVDTEFFTPVREEPEPFTAIFTGLLGWGPNVSAIHFLVNDIWPKVKAKAPGAQLYLAGKNPAKQVVQWAAADPTVTLVANPEDMRPWLARAAVSVCPIVEGGGTRLKILDALAMGKPMVTTTIGCEGLRVTHGENILVADAPEAFASAIAHLFESRDLRNRLGTAGRMLVEREYSWVMLSQQLAEAYAACEGTGARASKAAPVESV